LGVLRYLQALGQCSHFLATHLPAAKLVRVTSTAAAADAISTQADDGGDDDADSAAICSKICLQLFDNLEMVQEGIQDSHGEFEPRLGVKRSALRNLSSHL
jgi:prephenate dehydratase